MKKSAPHAALSKAVSRAIASGSPVFVNQPAKKALTKRQQAAVKKDYLAWSGGFTPDLHDQDYVDCGAHDGRLDEQAVRDFIEGWREECEAKAEAKHAFGGEYSFVGFNVRENSPVDLPEGRKPVRLSKKNVRDLARAVKAVQYGDLYDHLHRVGDDPVKSEIEDVLLAVLDPTTFRKVVAVFAVATSDDI